MKISPIFYSFSGRVHRHIFVVNQKDSLRSNQWIRREAPTPMTSGKKMLVGVNYG